MNHQVKDYMSKPYAFVTVNDTLDKALETMSRYNTMKITVTDEQNYIYAIVAKTDLYKYIGSKSDMQKFSSIKIKDVIDESQSSIVAYPENDVFEALTIMDTLGIGYLPIGKSQWEKRLVGFISAKDVQLKLMEN